MLGCGRLDDDSTNGLWPRLSTGLWRQNMMHEKFRVGFTQDLVIARSHPAKECIAFILWPRRFRICLWVARRRLCLSMGVGKLCLPHMMHAGGGATA